jgi:hypothetical protein
MATLTRSQRAMQIERRTHRQWVAGAAVIRIPSQTTVGVIYTTTLDSCSCNDAFYRRDGKPCKHSLAARILYGRLTAQERKNS